MLSCRNPLFAISAPQDVIFLFQYHFTILFTKGKDGVVQIFTGEFYCYFSAYKLACTCFKETIVCSSFHHISDLINIHGFIVNSFLWLHGCAGYKTETSPPFLFDVPISERMCIDICLVEMMGTFCYYILTNQMALYIYSNIYTQSNKDGYASGLY